jgi:hypothetical protein
MRLRGLIGRLDDALNPIVVKELRQAVQSKFVVAVLLLFLGVQLLVAGIYLVLNSNQRNLGALDFQAGHELFAILHSVMLVTCMLFVPLYAGIRLAAERSDTHVDLVFVTTLPPRAIVGGKFLAALVVAVIIFSACTPFLFFTYFLRGIDWPTILFVVAVDFVTVAFAVMGAIFFALIPANWIFKSLLAMFGFVVLVILLYSTLALTLIPLLTTGVGALMESPSFWSATCCILAAVLGSGALLYSWSVALLSPPSANRALLWRVVFVVVWGAGLVVACTWSALVPEPYGPFFNWILLAGILTCLGMMIAINERESWSPRTARTIPRRWWLRGWAFLFYSGAAGGLTLSVVLFVLTLLMGRVGSIWFDRAPTSFLPYDPLNGATACVGIAGLYVFSYALTAVLLRRLLAHKIPAVFTWVVMVVLVGVGCLVPFLISFLLFYGRWRYETYYPWLVSNPFVAINEMGEGSGQFDRFQMFFLVAALAWAAVAALLNVSWFCRQLRAFRPYSASGATLDRDGRPVVWTAAQTQTTKTV